MRIFRLGDEGPEVLDIQRRLLVLGHAIDPAELSGPYGPTTEIAVRAFQELRGLRVDGIVGPDSWGQLVEAGWRLGDRTLYLHEPMFRGDDVRGLQRRLNALGFDVGKEDGLHGARTDHAVREFQRNVGGDPDGIVGPQTLVTLERMRPVGLSRALVREQEELRGRQRSIEGQPIAIDPGNSPGNGMQPSSAVPDPAFAMATALVDELTSTGAKPVLLRPRDQDPGTRERARIANEMGAALIISLHVPPEASHAGDPTCSYYGSATSHSPAGMHLAELILYELEAEFGRVGRLQRLTVAMLRETRMPAVQIEPPLGNDAGSSALNAASSFAQRVGRAVAAGTQRFFHS